MATATIDAAAEEVGPVQGTAAILALSGTCTDGGIIVLVRPQGGNTYYPSAYITAAMIQQVPNVAGDGYGFVHGVQIPGGGHAKAVASSAFVGSLAAEILPASVETISAGGAGLGILGDSAAVPVAQSADADLTEIAGQPVEWLIALADSATTDGMDVTITAKDASGATVTGVRTCEFWMSESAVGIGLTADAYSGNLTITTGTQMVVHTAKKHISALTDANGVLAFTLVDSANPADQYVAVKRPVGDALSVSAASGTNWEGA